MSSELEELASAWGIVPHYVDVWGRAQHASPETEEALLAAMGVDVERRARPKRALEQRALACRQRPLPPVLVLHCDEPVKIPVTVPASLGANRLGWRLAMDGGEERSGEIERAELTAADQNQDPAQEGFLRYVFSLPVAPPAGYHRFELLAPGLAPARMRLIVAPARCYEPPLLGAGHRVWGFSVQLYALRSRRNWGVGDFGDLRAVIDISAAWGAQVVGVSPLHALALHQAQWASPYSPSHRCFINPLYLEIEAIGDCTESPRGRERMASPSFQSRLEELRASEWVDYVGVGALKWPLLELGYAHFRAQHLAALSARGRAFRAYQEHWGEPLRAYALHEALQAHFWQLDPNFWGWPAWPEAYRDRRSAEVEAFAAAHPEAIEFYAYVQWQCDVQLERLAERARERGMGIGLYLDLALGTDRGGAETWIEPELFAVEASAGAPPDEYNRTGQDWGLPPPVPDRLRETGYAHFADVLRANMRHAGALRLDHVMALQRLFCIPQGLPPAAGAYIRYPFDDLLSVLCLESERNRCLVIGEDLGTVSQNLRAALAQAGVLTYRPLYFEKDANGAFRPPEAYPAQALASIGTHDLPTLRGFWQDRDLEWRARLALYPLADVHAGLLRERAHDRLELVQALRREGLALPAGPETWSPELSRAVHEYVARSAARAMVVQAEDALGELEQMNLPGTIDEHPNWRRKLAVAVEDWPRQGALAELARAINRARARPAGATQTPKRPLSHVPLATYRLQLNRDFTFADASALVPYLAALGVSHCYTSPFFKARSGSVHGYDVIDHQALNPEIGGREDLENFFNALRAHDMGLVVDVVPNHMGVFGSDNAWWLDVLENGQASIRAEFFDIDWEPLKDALRGKVLLPVLSEHYGSILDRGELRLAFDPDAGGFHVSYEQHRLPVDPRTYPAILRCAMDAPDCGLEPAGRELLEQIVQALAGLSGRQARSEELRLRRRNDARALKARLAELWKRHEAVRACIGKAVQTYNSPAGEAPGTILLHELLDAQAYRLAYWRVASDEINYRRFFDINDLAALRMENEAVFEATHRLLAELMETGPIDGLRIDHPDGLYDPGEYIRRLRAHFGKDAPGLPDAPSNGSNGFYLVLEKITAAFERLRADWAVQGTTGYRFSNVVNGLFVNGSAESALDRLYRAYTRREEPFEEVVLASKRLVVRTALSSELNVLARELSRIAEARRHTRDFSLNGLRDALLEVVACFPVYRTYLSASAPLAPEERRYIDWAVALARKRSPASDLTAFDFLHSVLTADIAENEDAAYRQQVLNFAQRVQQFTAPAMAKGMEDTAFYRYARLISLNDVGGEPGGFGISLAAFHAASADRAKRWPHTMLATSTHDCKRSEDARSRINLISEIPAEWRLALRRWTRINSQKKSIVDGASAPSHNDEYYLYQTLLGCWPLEPLDQAVLDQLRERVSTHMLKAVREAKLHTSWISPNAEYEHALQRFLDALLGRLDNNAFIAEFSPFVARTAAYGLLNSLSQTLVKLASPGVPDIYQGCELWSFSLADPDNRRPVDYAHRRRLLAGLVQGFAAKASRAASLAQLGAHLSDGRAKLYVTWRSLRLRLALPDLFQTGEYVAVSASGDKAEHVCAFARRLGDTRLLAVAGRFFAGLVDDPLQPYSPRWGDTRLELGALDAASGFIDALTGEELNTPAGSTPGELRLDALLARFPVALLIDAPTGHRVLALEERAAL